MTALKRIFVYGTVLCAMACGASGIINNGTLSTSDTVSTVTAAPTDAQANQSLLDPGGKYTQLCEDANQRGYGNGHGGDHGGDGMNPNCKPVICKYLQDECALQNTTEWQAAVQSPNFTVLCSDVSTLRQDACNSIVAATAQCQTATEQFDTDVQTFWQSSVFKALEGTSQYAAVQQDANQLQALGCFGNGNTTTTTTTTTGTTTAGTTTAGTTTAGTTTGANTGNTGNGDTAGATTQGTTTSVVISPTGTAGGTTTNTTGGTAGGTGNTGNGDTAGSTTGGNQ